MERPATRSDVVVLAAPLTRLLGLSGLVTWHLGETWEATDTEGRVVTVGDHHSQADHRIAALRGVTDPAEAARITDRVMLARVEDPRPSDRLRTQCRSRARLERWTAYGEPVGWRVGGERWAATLLGSVEADRVPGLTVDMDYEEAAARILAWERQRSAPPVMAIMMPPMLIEAVAGHTDVLVLVAALAVFAGLVALGVAADAGAIRRMLDAVRRTR